jgi:hypothetical protein
MSVQEPILLIRLWFLSIPLQIYDSLKHFVQNFAKDLFFKYKYVSLTVLRTFFKIISSSFECVLASLIRLEGILNAFKHVSGDKNQFIFKIQDLNDFELDFESIKHFHLLFELIKDLYFRVFCVPNQFDVKYFQFLIVLAQLIINIF